MADTKKVEIKPAKGRPMLQWVGKKPLRDVIAYPAQLVETFAPALTPALSRGERGNLWKDWPDKFPQGGLLFHGDNKDVLAYLLANGFRGKVKLIYIDPPFDSGADYIRKVSLRGKGNQTSLKGEGYDLGEQIQYTDIWANDNYLQFMYERLLLLKELLSDDGTIWVHCDWRKSQHLRCLLDEVFSPDSFRAHVIWRTMTSSGYKGKKSLGRSHADLLYYSKSEKFVYNPTYLEMTPEMRARYSHADPDGRLFKDSYLGDVSPETVEDLRKSNLLYVTSTGGFRIKHYLDEADGTLADDIWTDIDPENSQSALLTDYPTQKPEALLRRIVEITSNQGDIVLDCFIGSGTTAAVAQKLGRRWIGADINKGAIQTTSKRLQGIIEEQLKSAKGKAKALPGMEGEETPAPAQFSFAVYRVNDYDMQIQHNEAMNLACEHLGITRTKTDAFFDGALGKKLVKIVQFNHPITPLDLEEVKRELGNRPQEERDVVVVGYGKELAVGAWLEDWNRNRKRTGLPNQIDVKDLRVDAKSGGFFVHKPAEANIKFKRAGDKVSIEIADFLSPTVIERLKSQAGILTPQIKDWRSMVDSVMIDSNYDGKVFNITLADVPEKKNDLVVGKYEVEAKKGSTIAVKITDMLGEEVFVVKEV